MKWGFCIATHKTNNEKVYRLTPDPFHHSRFNSQNKFPSRRQAGGWEPSVESGRPGSKHGDAPLGTPFQEGQIAQLSGDMSTPSGVWLSCRESPGSSSCPSWDGPHPMTNGGGVREVPFSVHMGRDGQHSLQHTQPAWSVFQFDFFLLPSLLPLHSVCPE